MRKDGTPINDLLKRNKKEEKYREARKFADQKAKELADSVREQLEGLPKAAPLNTRKKETDFIKKLRRTPHLTPLKDRLK